MEYLVCLRLGQNIPLKVIDFTELYFLLTFK